MTSTSDPSSICPDEVIGRLHREEWGRLVSLVVTRTRRLDLAEDAVAEAFTRAVLRWPADGVPANPVGWLFTVAHRFVLGRLRSEAVAGRAAPLLAVRQGTAQLEPDESSHDESVGDERLQLILLCCHPALPRESRSALALRLVIGTPTEQIARLFLVSTTTMAARLTRAKRKILGAGIPLALPIEDELRSRLDEVCRTIYLAFTAAYAPAHGAEVVEASLAGEAVRLAEVLHRVAPTPPVAALNALLALTHARRDARTRAGRLVTLAEQDRNAWRHDEIRHGLALLRSIVAGSGPYADELRLQALIAAEHATASSADATDWRSISERYQELETLTGSPVVRLNRAVAVAEADGPRAGLALLEGLDALLGDHHRLASVRAELLRRAGEVDSAIRWFRLAVERCPNAAERDHLRRRLATLTIAI